MNKGFPEFNLFLKIKKELNHFGNSLVQITLFVVYVLEKELTVGCKCPLLIIMLMVGVRTDVHSRCVFFHVKMWRLFVGRSVCDPMRKRHCLSKKWDFFKAVKAHRPFFNFKKNLFAIFLRELIFFLVIWQCKKCPYLNIIIEMSIIV